MKKIPISSYRLQLSKDFPFPKATKLIPYLHDLGIEMIYTSPYLAIEDGSPNPYMIVSPDKIHEELGGEEAFKDFCTACNDLGMMHMMDLVPNHMGATPVNEWWFEVLKKGKRSKYAKFFDIEWDAGGGKVILPVLSDDAKIRKGKGVVIVNGRRYPMRKGTEELPLRKALEKQHYEMIHWKEGASRVNYRRFFDITDLVGLKMEDPSVYDRYDEKAFDWMNDGFIKAFRIDHPDGLWDPESYLKQIKKDAPDAYVVVEKILQSNETLRKGQKSDGSVGYDALNTLNRVFIDPKSQRKMYAIYKKFTQMKKNPRKLLVEVKREYIEKYFISEMDIIAGKLARVGEFSYEDYRKGLVEFLANTPIYRTFVRPNSRVIDPLDRKALHMAAAKMKGCKRKVRRFFRKGILERRYRKIFLRIQQLMPGCFAKGYEDTMLYRFFPQSALNEVGSEIVEYGMSVTEFHTSNLARQKSSPHTMITTSTHDTKRSLDTRMRISVISDYPKEFQKLLSFGRTCFGDLPNHNVEYLFYQSLVGIWPDKRPTAKARPELIKRLQNYMTKAIREGKDASDWIDPDEKFEKELKTFINTVCLDCRKSDFWNYFYPWQAKVTKHGMYKCFSTLLLKLAMPGVVDTYQGEETWFYALVDPDNRRKVNFDKQRRLVNQLRKNKPTFAQLLSWFTKPGDSKLKCHLLLKGLKLRKEHPDLFLDGTYEPLNLHEKDYITFKRRRHGKELYLRIPLFWKEGEELERAQVPKGFVDIISGKRTTPLPFTIAIKS